MKIFLAGNSENMKTPPPFSFPSLHVFGIFTIFLIFHFIMRLTLSQDQRPGTTADVPDNVGFLRVIFHEESFENEGP